MTIYLFYYNTFFLMIHDLQKQQEEDSLVKKYYNSKFARLVTQKEDQYVIDPEVLQKLTSKQEANDKNLAKALLQALYDPLEFQLFSCTGKKGKNTEKKPKLHPLRREAIIGTIYNGHLFSSLQQFDIYFSDYVHQQFSTDKKNTETMVVAIIRAKCSNSKRSERD